MRAMPILIFCRTYIFDKGLTSCCIYRQVRVIKINSCINDPGSFTNTITITNPVNIPGNQSRRCYSKATA